MPKSKTARPEKTGKTAPVSKGVFGQGNKGADPVLEVALYARVSSPHQQTIAMQLEQLEAYVQRRGWQVAVRVEEIESGAKKRPKRDALMQAARRREVDAILVWRLDRWGRSLSDLVVTLQELRELGVAFVSLNEAFDLTTPTGRAMAAMVAVFAEFEREIRSERVRAGIEHARQEGRHLGRPPTASLKVDRVCELVAEGLSKSEIARRLGIGRTSVRRILAKKSSAALEPKEKTKTMRVGLWLRVENNSKFVRGKKKSRQIIELLCLQPYSMKKPELDGWEYELLVPYESDEELDQTIEGLDREMANIADDRSGFIETAWSSLDDPDSDRW